MTPILLAMALAADPDPDAVALARSATDLSAALAELKQPLPRAVQDVIAKGNADEIEEALKPHVLLAATINPEGRVKVARGAADAAVVVGEPFHVVVRVENQSGGQQTLTAHGSYTGAERSPFDVRFASAGKITPALSGRLVEYRVLRVTCSAAGKRELTISFDAGQGTQDLGFRGEVPVLFAVTAARR
jgi:hypothetical protein